jgi:hypothetical protein
LDKSLKDGALAMGDPSIVKVIEETNIQSVPTPINTAGGDRRQSCVGILSGTIIVILRPQVKKTH